MFSSLATAASPPASEERAYGQFDFPTCVRYAFTHADAFLKNRIQIQLKSVDLKDAHADILPTLTVTTRYYLQRPEGFEDRNPFSVDFSMANWNPYLALLKIKSQGLMVDVARLNHFDKLSSGVREIARLFFAIDLQDRTLKASRQSLAMYRNKLNYGESLSQQGKMDAVALRTLANQARQQSLRVKEIERDKEDNVAKLKVLLGYHPDYHLPLDTRDAVDQILAGFNGRGVTFADVQAENWQLKMAAKKEQLQGCAVTGSYVAILPQPMFLLEGLSNQVDRSSGVSISVGLNYTLWDGFKRVRDIKRQKLNAEIARIERDNLSKELYTSFRKILNEIETSAERESLRREDAKLSELSEEKAYVQYKAGELPLDSYLDHKIKRTEASIQAISALQQRVGALLELATMAGGLNRYNGRIGY
ncbi:MAG: TolC family protein [Thermodesulfobacteriota bacterium]